MYTDLLNVILFRAAGGGGECTLPQAHVHLLTHLHHVWLCSRTAFLFKVYTNWTVPVNFPRQLA